ncbi:hypothetical protein GSU68_10695 [Rathayibacter sp. VKM Ac-2759]|uniref:hypothetical protein n=1 Tax=Rathayibacter sp. VKM Ac-2759 TaxID=2609252 RepID=UPI0013197A62|nr:hypothetical protein [Rathayibacter sp. VKM Ac-2759]QHC66981.1 hypothetical protein GSU68_10695 [Rathayibacter sp. VKM Ac-2759]
MTTTNRGVTAATLAALALATAGCSATEAAAPEPTSTAETAIDYLYYDLPELVASADRIVEGTVVSTSSVTVYPTVEEGDDPLLNPMSDATQEEREQARLEGAIAGTEVVIDVTATRKGDSDSRITLMQTGGVLDGVLYRSDSAPLLVEGEDYLLFLSEGDRPSTLGGGAGTYTVDDDEYLAMASHAPVERLSAEELDRLLG